MFEYDDDGNDSDASAASEMNLDHLEDDMEPGVQPLREAASYVRGEWRPDFIHMVRHRPEPPSDKALFSSLNPEEHLQNLIAHTDSWTLATDDYLDQLPRDAALLRGEHRWAWDEANVLLDLTMRAFLSVEGHDPYDDCQTNALDWYTLRDWVLATPSSPERDDIEMLLERCEPWRDEQNHRRRTRRAGARQTRRRHAAAAEPERDMSAESHRKKLRQEPDEEAALPSEPPPQPEPPEAEPQPIARRKYV